MLSITKVLFRLLIRDEGNVAILFGLAIPVLLGLTALGVDSALINHQKDWMQNTADSVSLAVAKELHLYQDKTDQLKSVGVGRAEALATEGGYAANEHQVDVLVDDDERRVTVTFTMTARPFLPGDIWSENPITVTSTAIVYGSAKLCVLGLDPSKPKTIETKHGATLTSPECAIQSNSTDREGIAVTGGATINSAGTCSAGGIQGADGISPKPEVDCPVIEDPLADRAPPTIGGCDFLDFKVDKGESTISPGTYCGGIKMDNDAIIRAEPGIYVITGGKLDMGNQTQIYGDEVSFYFADDAAGFDFRDKGIVELSAPKKGPMAGILFYSTIAGEKFKISSDSARKLLGTIYLPNANLEISGGGKVAQESAYTVILAEYPQGGQVRPGHQRQLRRLRRAGAAGHRSQLFRDEAGTVDRLTEERPQGGAPQHGLFAPGGAELPCARSATNGSLISLQQRGCRTSRTHAPHDAGSGRPRQSCAMPGRSSNQGTTANALLRRSRSDGMVALANGALWREMRAGGVRAGDFCGQEFRPTLARCRLTLAAGPTPSS